MLTSSQKKMAWFGLVDISHPEGPACKGPRPEEGENIRQLVLPMSTPDEGILGNSHMIMQDKNNLQIAALIIKWIDERGGKRKAANE